MKKDVQRNYYLCVLIVKEFDMETKIVSKAMSDKISFVSFIVPAFAEAYKMSVPVAFKYLKKYGGWDFLNKHWWALHTDNDIWAIHYIYQVCYKNGGMR